MINILYKQKAKSRRIKRYSKGTCNSKLTCGEFVALVIVLRRVSIGLKKVLLIKTAHALYCDNGPLRSWQTRTHCCGHIVADSNVSLFARARNFCCGHKFFVRDTKNVSDFVQKHFVSATNVSQLVQPKKHCINIRPCPQQCVLVCQYLKASSTPLS